MTSTPWPSLAAIAIILAAGVARGWRPGPLSPAEALAFSERLGRACPSAGPWEGREVPVDRRELEAAGVEGRLARRYSRPDGRALTVLLVCGRPGPISVHTPDVCYAGAGFRAEAAPALWSPRPEDGVGPSTFRSAAFAGADPALPDRYQILWSWTDSGTWAARDDPRLAFADSPMLCKIYVIRELRPGEPAGVDGATVDFLRRFVPEFRRAQFGGPAARARDDRPRRPTPTLLGKD